MSRLLRRRYLLLIFLGLLVAVGLAARSYFRSEAAARTIAERLTHQIGAPVQFDAVDVGTMATTIANLRVHERSASADSTPFLQVGSAEADLSAVGAAVGREPSAIRLRDAQVLLRFDRDGDLLTQLPLASGGGRLPTVHIQSGTLTLRQIGRPDSVFTGIDLTVAPTPAGISIAGIVEDADWGEWSVTGNMPTDSSDDARLTLATTTPHRVTPELLARVPFVNPNAWKHVGLQGTTPARIELGLDRRDERVHYRVALQPTQTTVDIPSIGLTVADAAGELTAEEGIVTLADVRGRAADGEVAINARLDFSQPKSRLQFLTDLSGLDVRKLPRAWRLPPELTGRLTGKLQFYVGLAPGGGTTIEAVGRATVNDAQFNGVPTEPIELTFGTSRPGEFEFSERGTGGKRHVVHKAVEDPPPDPAPRPGLLSRSLRFIARLVKPADAAQDEKAYLHVNLTFKDVDVADLIKAAGVQVPLPLSGRVTVHVTVDIPTERPNDLSAYRLQGTVTTQRLLLDELPIENASAELAVRNGLLEVTNFVGRFGTFDGVSLGGTFRARGEMRVGGDWAYQATVKLDRVPLENLDLVQNIAAVPVPLAGPANGHVTLEGTLAPPTLRANGEGRVQNARLGTIPADEATFRFETEGDMLRFRDVSATLFGGDVQGQFDIPLREDLAGVGELRIDGLDLGEISKSLLAGADLKLEGKAAGTIRLRSPAAGEGGARGATAEVAVQAPSMKFRGIPAKQLKGTVSYAEGAARYKLTAEALGGQIEAEGKFDPAAKKPPAKAPKNPPKKGDGLNLGQIRFRSIQLSQLWEIVGVRNAIRGLEADVSGDFPLTTDDSGRLVGTGKIRADRVRFNDMVLATTGQAVIRLTPRELSFEDMTAWVGEGVVRGHISLDRNDVDRSWARATLTNVPSRTLLFLLPELSTKIDVAVDGRLTTTLGREWRGTGVLTGLRGTAYGIPVSDVRIPVDWTAIPSRGRTEVRVRDATANAAGGRVTARMEINSFNDLAPQVKGRIDFSHVNLSRAVREAERVVGNLTASGQFEFSADQYRKPGDLTGTFRASLGESQPFGLPVFSSIVPYLGFGGSAPVVNQGDARAVLANGVWKVQRFTLSGPSIELFADGTVTTDGRLHLSVATMSRQRPLQAVVQRMLPISSVSAVGNRPLGQSVIANAVGLLGNYVIYLEVTGSIRSPVVRLETLRTLSEDAVRFFLFRYLAP